MKLSEYIKKISEEQDHLYYERRKMNSKHKEELKEINRQIEDKKLLISNIYKVINKYSCLDVKKIGYYIADLMSNIEEDEYVFHRSKVSYKKLYFEYDKYTSTIEEGTIYMISPKDKVKKEYNVEYYAEYQTNPLPDSKHVLFDKDDEFYFYDYTFRERYFTKYPYIKDFIDNVIDMKYEKDMGIINEDENKLLSNIYEQVLNKYKKPKTKIKSK